MSANKYPQLDFPVVEKDFRFKKEGGREFIWDLIRKQWVVVSPEEWVRQNLISFLVHFRNYIPPLMGIEKSIQWGGMKKRFDLLAYNSLGAPVLLVECKAPHIPISRDVLFQAQTYNSVVNGCCILITNGLQHVAYQKVHGEQRMQQISDVPFYRTLDN